MFARKGVLFSSIGRAAVMATVAALALTVVEPSLALAGSPSTGKGRSAVTATSDATDFSARRRVAHRRGGRVYGRDGAAAAAAFAGILGTGLAIAAQSQGGYDDGYYGGPGYYYGGNPYYGGYGYGYGRPGW